jgi:hypothetical protein
MMTLTVKIVGKDIKSDNGDFTAYSALTSKGNWYKLAKVKKEELEKVNGEVVKLTVSRKFDKEVMSEGLEIRKFPTLVVEEMITPTPEELNKFNDELDKFNSKTLVGIM